MLLPGGYVTHLVFVRFEHSVCRGSLMTTYIYTQVMYVLQLNSARCRKTEQCIYMIAGNTNKLIYCNSEFHVFTVIR